MNTQDILNVVVELGNWKGTAAELVKVLGLNISPRALSAQLKKLQEEFKNYGISITWDRKRDKRIIIISNSDAASQSEVTLRHTIQTTSQDNSFASHIQKQPIEFPFEWQYGTIAELSKKERTEVNRVRHQGRKSYQKPCSVCGEEGVLEYRKNSDGNSTLLCELCCKSYIASTIELQETLFGTRVHKKTWWGSVPERE